MSSSSLDTLQTDIEDILSGRAPLPDQGLPLQTALNTQTQASESRSNEERQTASFGVYLDDISDEPVHQSHQEVPHGMPNMLAPRPQNQSNIPPRNVSYLGAPTYLGKRRRDEPQIHQDGDEDVRVFKKPFPPSYRSTDPPPQSTARRSTQPKVKQPRRHTQQQYRSETRMPASQPRLQNEVDSQALTDHYMYGAASMPAAGPVNVVPGPRHVQQHAKTSGQQQQQQPPGSKIARLGPVIPSAYESLPGFDDPNLFRPASEMSNTQGQPYFPEVHSQGSSFSHVSGDFRQRPIKAAHDALQQALSSSDEHAASSTGPSEQVLLSAEEFPIDNQESAASSPQSNNDVDDQGEAYQQAEGHQSSEDIPMANRTTTTTPRGDSTRPPLPSVETAYNYYRNKRPETEADKINVCLAIAHSRLYFLHQYGFKPQPTCLTESFAEQYEQMQAEYRQFLVDGMDPVLHEPIGAWRTGYDDWECAWGSLGDWFGDCVVCLRRNRP